VPKPKFATWDSFATVLAVGIDIIGAFMKIVLPQGEKEEKQELLHDNQV
jgi:hypothetical protein